MDPAKSISSQVPVATALTSSSLSQLRASASNFSAYLNPSPKDLLMVLPRIIIRAGSFTFITVPEQLDNIFGLRAGGRVIAEATREGAHNMASAALSSAALVQGNAGENVGAIATETIREQASTLRDSFSFQQIRNFGGVFSYITSKWALGCFTIVGSRSLVIWDERHKIGSCKLITFGRQLSSTGPRSMHLHAAIWIFHGLFD